MGNFFLTLISSAVFAVTAQATPLSAVAPHRDAAPVALAPIKVQATKEAEISIVVKDRRRRGERMDVTFAVRVENLAREKKYQFFLQDLGMKTQGLPQAPAPDKNHRWTADEAGSLTFNFQVNGFVQGEWIQFTIRSTDGQVNKTVRYVPFK
ncbi:MAG: hypothetical protein AB7S99_07830 [Pseudodonghicola sp.]